MVRRSVSRISFFERARYAFADWSAGRAIGISPEQPVLFTGTANDFLRILMHRRIAVRRKRVFFLGFNVSATDLNGVQFIGSDTPEQYLIVSGLAVKIPLPLPLHDWDWQWPILLAYLQDRCAFLDIY